MSTERRQKINELFKVAVSQPAEERQELLRSACASDPTLRADLELLLAAHDEAGARLIGSGSVPRGYEAPSAGLLALPPGQRIGRFTVRSVLGLGGMSVVYEAEQDDPPRRVALKILRTGMLAPELVRRFEREAALLGRLRHPGVAEIYEAGTGLSLGLPYIAMELVEGEPLTAYAARCKLDQRQRIELFLPICDAVEYAHVQGVIHRDLKPANIIVTAAGRPKVLDFGAALLRDADSSLATFVTMPGQLIGTLPYMSPEQAGGERLGVGVGSDVYSLGVILYQLLTGRLPCDLTEMTLVQAAAAICMAPPPLPSALDPAIDGTLDAILLRALAKRPAERQPTAEALARELRNYLQGRATPPPRQRSFRIAPFALAAAALLIVAVGVTAAIRFWPVQPGPAPAPAVQAPPERDQVDSSFTLAGTPFRPDLKRWLGTEVDQLLQEKAALLEASNGPPPHRLWRDYAELLELRGRFAEAERAYRAVLRSGFPPHDARRGELMTEEKIAGVLAARGAYAEAEQIWRDLVRQVDDPELESWQAARIHLRYGMLLKRCGRSEEAIGQINAAIAVLETERAWNKPHLDVARSILEDARK